MKNTDKKITSSKQKLPIPLLILALLALLGLLVFAGVIGGQLIEKLSSTKDDARQQSAVTKTESQTTEPISILPDKPDGVTVLEKQPEQSEEISQTALAPVTQGAEAATGFGLDLGASDSYLDLTKRFADLTVANGAEYFQRLEPRAVLRETVTGLEARLLIGPFKTEKQANEACAVLIIPEGGSCTAVIFQGDLIARE